MAIDIGDNSDSVWQLIGSVWQLIAWEDGFWGHFLELHGANPSLS